jgi:hypothetical protein
LTIVGQSSFMSAYNPLIKPRDSGFLFVLTLFLVFSSML